MAIVYVNVNVGSRRYSGSQIPTAAGGGAVAGDLTVAFDDTKILTKGDFLAACRAAADVVSGKLK